MPVDRGGPAVAAAAGDLRAVVAERIRRGLGVCRRNGIPAPPVAGPTLAALEAGGRVVVPGWFVPRALEPAWVKRRQLPDGRWAGVDGHRMPGVVLGPGRRVEFLRAEACGRLALLWLFAEDPAAHDAALAAKHGPGWWRQHVECCGLVGPS